MRAIAALLVVCLASCHLADAADPPTCVAGSHAENGHCVVDPGSGPTITIAAGSGAINGSPCTVSPDSIAVEGQGSFSFSNQDTVDHVITGGDGKDWATAKAGQSSPFIAITKAGSWPYKVSGCAKGGTVVVE